jgi:hypothetical protein
MDLKSILQDKLQNLTKDTSNLCLKQFPSVKEGSEKNPFIISQVICTLGNAAKT